LGGTARKPETSLPFSLKTTALGWLMASTARPPAHFTKSMVEYFPATYKAAAQLKERMGQPTANSQTVSLAHSAHRHLNQGTPGNGYVNYVMCFNVVSNAQPRGSTPRV
jgi:hypothetical protein